MKTMNRTLLVALLSTLGLTSGLAEAAFDPAQEIVCRTTSGMKIQANDNITGPRKAFAGSAQIIDASYLRDDRSEEVTILLGSGIRAAGTTMKLILSPRDARLITVEDMKFYTLHAQAVTRGSWGSENKEDATCFQPAN